jgi:hypothetical protein
VRVDRIVLRGVRLAADAAIDVSRHRGGERAPRDPQGGVAVAAPARRTDADFQATERRHLYLRGGQVAGLVLNDVAGELELLELLDVAGEF